MEFPNYVSGEHRFETKFAFLENTAIRARSVEEHIIEEKKTCVVNGAGVKLDSYQVLKYPKKKWKRYVSICWMCDERKRN